MIDQRLRSNLRRINRALRRKERLHGQQVTWYVYIGDVANDDATDTDIYDEGLGYTRTWATGIPLGTIQAYYDMAQQTNSLDGLYIADSLRLTISAEVFRNGVGVELLDPRHHLHDRFLYEGRYYSVSSFELLGRVGDLYTIVAVTGAQVTAEDGFFDAAGQPGV